MSRRGHGCGDCIHNGCCDELPYCGGSAWSPAYGECEQCGGRVSLEDCEWQTEDGEHIFCSESCMGEWLDENCEDEEEAEDGE